MNEKILVELLDLFKFKERDEIQNSKDATLRANIWGEARRNLDRVIDKLQESNENQ